MQQKPGPQKGHPKTKPAKEQPVNHPPHKEIVDFPLEKLKEHPLQKTIYRDRADCEIEELAQSMAHGQDEPVEILPDGTLIAGHTRTEAAKRLAWKTIRAWVRHDLAGAGPQAVEARLIEANLYRRQLTRLDMASSYRHLPRLARDKKGQPVGESEAERNLRTLITERFRVSEKTLSRWLHVLNLPCFVESLGRVGASNRTEPADPAPSPVTDRDCEDKSLKHGYDRQTNERLCAYLDALEEFVNATDATGGVTSDDHGDTVPVADED